MSVSRARISSRSRSLSARSWLELACGVFADPRGLCACVVGACLGGRGALVGGLRGLPVLLGLLARLVPVVLSGADEGLGVGPGLADRSRPAARPR